MAGHLRTPAGKLGMLCGHSHAQCPISMGWGALGVPCGSGWTTSDQASPGHGIACGTHPAAPEGAPPCPFPGVSRPPRVPRSASFRTLPAFDQDLKELCSAAHSPARAGRNTGLAAWHSCPSLLHHSQHHAQGPGILPAAWHHALCPAPAPVPPAYTLQHRQPSSDLLPLHKQARTSGCCHTQQCPAWHPAGDGGNRTGTECPQ